MNHRPHGWNIALACVAALCATTAAFALAAAGRAAPAARQPPPAPVILRDGQEVYPLGRSLALLADPSGELTLADVRSPAYEAQFAASEADEPSLGVSRGAYWARFALRNESSEPLWLLELGRQQPDYVDFYLIDEDGQLLAETRTGRRLPFATRDVQSLAIAMRLATPPGASATGYLRISNAFSARFTVDVLSVSAFAYRGEGRAALSAVIYGAFALLAVYCLLKAVTQRDPLYAVLTVMLTGQTLTFAGREGWGARLLWPQHPHLGEVIMHLAIAVVLLMFLAFCSSYLQMRRQMPRLHRVIRPLALAIGAATLLIAPAALGALSPQIVTLALVTLAAPVLILLPLAGLIALRNGFKPARYFVIALLVPSLFGLFDIAMLLGLQPRMDAAAEIAKLGNLILVGLLSAAAGQATRDAVAAATANERTRLARELHDSVTQTLFSASIMAEMAQEQLAAEPAEAQQSLARLGQLTDGALAEMRSLLMELRPAALHAAPLEQLMANLAQAACVRSRAQVRSEAHGEAPAALPGEVRVAVYRIAQELLNNVVKHSAAATCVVRLDYLPRGLILTVRDDGKGFDMGPMSAERMGIAIMQERARAIGGRLTLCSEPGLGTTAELRWGETDSEGTLE